jgi:hypothetical protein
MNFVQAMIVPTMVSLGVGTLLVAQNLSLMEVSYAAPAAAPVGGAAPGAAGAKPGAPGAKPGAPGAKPGSKPGAQPGQGALPLPADGGTNSPEFGGKGPDGTVIRAITDQELQIKAVESSGREDPFMALVPPDATQIIPPPLPSMGPITVPPIQTPAPIKPATTPAPVAPKPAPVVTAPKPTPKIEDLPFAGDKAPPPQEPQWLIRGVISTGLERVCLLEGRDEQIHGRVGDKLSDGSVIEAISNRGVTFIRSGRRFVKLIGGQL